MLVSNNYLAGSENENSAAFASRSPSLLCSQQAKTKERSLPSRQKLSVGSSYECGFDPPGAALAPATNALKALVQAIVLQLQPVDIVTCCGARRRRCLGDLLLLLVAGVAFFS
jgi:hypothetical protein